MVDREARRLQAQRPFPACAVRLAAAVAVLGTVAGAGPVAAQPRLLQACGDALSTWCAPLAPGGGRLLDCLHAHEAELSPACRTLLDHTVRAGAPSPGTHRLGPRSLRACHDDLAAQCGGIRSGGGRLRACLDGHREVLSPTCVRALGADDEPGHTGGGVPGDHPAQPPAEDASR